LIEPVDSQRWILDTGGGGGRSNHQCRRCALATTTHSPPSVGAKITKFYVVQAAPGSREEPGSLHIIYSNGTQITQLLPSLKKNTDKETVFNQVGFSGVQLAEDQNTLGWAVNVENCCTSYSIRVSVVHFRSGRVLHSSGSGQTVWKWMYSARQNAIGCSVGTTRTRGR